MKRQRASEPNFQKLQNPTLLQLLEGSLHFEIILLWVAFTWDLLRYKYLPFLFFVGGGLRNVNFRSKEELVCQVCVAESQIQPG